MPDMAGVDELWVGYPIWWYTHPRIINTFFDQADLVGIKVHLFATSGGTGIQGSIDELKKTYPEVDIKGVVGPGIAVGAVKFDFHPAFSFKSGEDMFQ